MSHEVESCIGAFAARQHGVVSHSQLVESGLSPSGIDRRVHAGRLRPLHRGVYLASPFELAHSREMAAVLAIGPGAVLSHLSALALWGFHGGAAAESTVDVSARAHHTQRPGIHVHRCERLGPNDWTVREGIPVTTAERTLLDVAAILALPQLEAAVSRAEREGLVTGATLSRLLARNQRQKGVGALRAVLDASGGAALTRSEAEARLLALIRAAGLPAPECNVSLGRYEIDFLWRAAGIAVEVDGFRYHGNRPRFEGDRRRDAQLLAAGITVVRLSWRQITEEAIATAVQLGQALARAGGRR